MFLQPIFNSKKLILASASPRRKDLLKMLGLDFIVDPPHIDEYFDPNLKPEELAISLAEQKGIATISKYDEAIIVSADTVVVLQDQILGKPKDKKDAFRILRLLSGNTHQVITGISIIDLPDEEPISFFEKTAVTFNSLTDEEIEGYIETGSPMDKAGAYGIQDLSSIFIPKVDGCFYNVVGFPLAKFYQVCKDHFNGRMR